MLRIISGKQQTYKNKLEKAKLLKKTSKADLDTLKVQAKALQLLSHNLDLSNDIQEALLESVSGKGAKVNGSTTHKQAVSVEDLLAKKKEEKPEAEDVIEQQVRNRITQRFLELETLPANIATVDAKDTSLESSDSIASYEDRLKVDAVVELKALRLLTKQKSMRQHIVYNLAAKSDEASQTLANRALCKRVKIQTAQELRLTEQLEQQQRMERLRQERQIHAAYLEDVMGHVSDFRDDMQDKKRKSTILGKAILQAHIQIEKEESRRAERIAKQRLQALRANDEEAYIKLLDQAKDSRIHHLLRQTNSFLDSLSAAVMVQQQESGHSISSTHTEEGKKIDYYDVAHKVKEEITTQPSILVGGKLKEYQIKGLQWMVSLYNNNLNGILADEMGLGKTIQSISLITHLIEVKQEPGPYLVIVPLSTLTNWTMEFEKWAPSVKKVVYKGPPNARKSQQAVIRSGDFQVLLTTYEYIIKDRPLLSKLRWVYMIIDEGHRMKNTQSKLSFTLTKYYYSRHRLILTGTPLQNNLPELWALLNFVLPKIFNSVKTFDEWFNTPFANTGGQDKMDLTEEETLLIIKRLHKVLRPFLLRRLKKDVEKDLPDKVEKVIKCKMSALQAKIYDHMLKHNVLFVGQKDSGGKLGIKGLNNKIMQLRKICNHPFAFEEVESMINPTQGNSDLLWRTAGKFELLDRVMPKFIATGHRVLMFFQMTQIMDIMEDYLRLRGVQYLRLDGSTKADERSEMLKLYNAPDSPYFAFLLSTRAGGLGLNLQTADTVIIYDTDWNPHQDLQAQDRAHRIGQTKEVRILRLITEDSVEEAILERAHSKLEIDSKVIQAGKFDNKSTSEEQEAFLRSVIEAEEARRSGKEEDEEIDEDELNEILARSEDEHRLFKKMDEDRARTDPYGKNRLFTEDELPEAYKREVSEVLAPKKEKLPDKRERKAIFYDDGLTEKQWLDAVDNDEDLEATILRERKRQERRKGRTPIDDGDSEDEEVDEDDADEDDADDADEAEVDLSDEEPTRSKRKRKSGVAAEESQIEEERTPARRKARTSSAKTSDTLSPEDRAALTSRSKELYEAVTDITDDDGRSQVEFFLTLPAKKVYPDYYMLIQQPIALDGIKKKINNHSYTSLSQVKADFDLMVENAKTYNEPGSVVYDDAEAVHTAATAKFNALQPSTPVIKLKLK